MSLLALAVVCLNVQHARITGCAWYFVEVLVPNGTRMLDRIVDFIPVIPNAPQEKQKNV